MPFQYLGDSWVLAVVPGASGGIWAASLGSQSQLCLEACDKAIAEGPELDVVWELGGLSKSLHQHGREWGGVGGVGLLG